MRAFIDNPLLKKIFFASVFSIVSVFTLQLLTAPKAYAAAYDSSRLIDNAVFLDAQSMSAGDVQNFFSSKGAGLANMSFLLDCDLAGSQAKQIYQSLGAPCGQEVPASHIIYYATQVYGVSPKVILATMQKEQGVATAANPTSWQINQAMGYACPTSGSCEGGSNFFYQIDNGTWVLRYHYERARGNNNWWSPSSSWVCGTAKPSYYTPNLYPGQNVNFVDPYSGVQYATVYIQNAATSAFYCYTPHVFNNHNNSPHPNEPKGSTRCYSSLPAAGDRGRCYTGSYNFVYFYELWFGSTLVPQYAAQAVEQSPYPAVMQSKSAPAYIKFKNTGSSTWFDDISAPAAYEKPVRLATDNLLNRSSPFSQNWPQPNRPATTFARVTTTEGTLSSNQHVVQPGEFAEFWFSFDPTLFTTNGKYTESFRPVVEGLGPMNDTGSYFDVTVIQALYSAQAVKQSQYPSIYQGQGSTFTILYKNIGNIEWYDAVTAGPSKQKPIRLANDYPLNRQSNFSDGWAFGPTRPSHIFTSVYESDGVTLTSSQHVVNPGQIVTFTFSLRAPNSISPGEYTEHIRPIVEGFGPMNDTGTFYKVIVSKAEYKAQAISQSPYPSLQPGQEAPSYLLYRNTGSTPWYSGSLAEQHRINPVRLGTDMPLNRNSEFSSEIWFSKNRPSKSFGKVLNSDGTMATNQELVLPGQYGEFWFSIKAKIDASPGSHIEGFRPIVEGFGPMNDTGTFLGVTVSQP